MGGFHFPPAQKPLIVPITANQVELLVAVSVTDVRLCQAVWCVWNGGFHVHVCTYRKCTVFFFHLPDEMSSERAPAFGVKLRAWPAQDSGRWGA